jgi:hypothetical protein
MADYIEVPDPFDKAQQLVGMYGAEILPRQPGGLDEVSSDKALVCVLDNGVWEAASYIAVEEEFARFVDPADHRTRTWLLMDRQRADELCPEAAERRRQREPSLAGEAEAAAYPDNLLPVARVSRGMLKLNAEALRRYASALRGEWHGPGTDDLRHDESVRMVAATDLKAIAQDLASWAERDWVAVIDLGPGRENLEGPLPKFPGGSEVA